MTWYEKLINGIVNTVLLPVSIAVGGINLFPDDTNPTVVNVDDLDFTKADSINAFNLMSYPDIQDINNQIALDLSDGKMPSSYNINVVEQFYQTDFNNDGKISGLTNKDFQTKNNNNQYSSLYLIGGLLLILSIS